jgi:hypothetical protein
MFIGQKQTYQSQRNRLRRLFGHCLFITIITVFSQSAFGQMSYNTTTYVDLDIIEGSEGAPATIHTWAYTYAPSGTGVYHGYVAKARLRFPWSGMIEQTSQGSYYSPAVADIYRDFTQADASVAFEGDLEILSSHEAFCQTLGRNFFAFGSHYPFRIRIVQLTTRNINSTPIPRGKLCGNVPACTNPGIPICGALGSFSIETDPYQNCCAYYKAFYFFVLYPFGGRCTPGASVCWAGPGYCTVFP